MKRYKTFIILAIIFLAISGLLYFLHFNIFHDSHHIFIYLLGDIAFLPIEVFLVVIVIERILARREKQAMLQKLNMVIGAFFSEVGNQLLHNLLGCFESNREICQRLTVRQDWTHADFRKAVAHASAIKDQPRCASEDLEGLRRFLVQKRPFLLGLLENPNLLEHERFTDLLWATFHLTEELEARQSFQDLPATDLAHLAGDIQRVYHHLAAEWECYVEHLKSNYPFLFSLVVRMQPFKESPSPVVK
jgi:hypothetical protein